MDNPSLEGDALISKTLVEVITRQPWRFGFLALMRRINANRSIDPVGTAMLPGAEPYRIGQKPSLLFAPSEIADAALKNGKLTIRHYGLGVLGPNGPLPIHVTEIAREREEQRRDPTLCNFLDVFQHRSLTLLFRAWARAQATVSLDRPEQDRFSVYVSTLSGFPQRRSRPWPLPVHARLSVAPHLARQPRNVGSLGSMVAHHFGVPVVINENLFHWMASEPEEHSLLGEERMSSFLGEGAVLGEQMPDRMSRFQMVIGPLDIDDYHRFTPEGDDLLRLIACVRAFVGRQFTWELKLLIKPQSAPPALLGGEHQLGWSSWLGESPTGDPIVGMRFEPDHYLGQLRANAARRSIDVVGA